MNSWLSPRLCPAFLSQLCGFPGLGFGFVLGQGVSSGCVGGSFSSVTLALLETPVEKIPDLFQPLEFLLVPSELLGTHYHQ